MGIPLIPAIAAGTHLLGQGINAFAQGSMNRKQRKYNLKMYEIQRMDALKDWAMQNEYNSPAAQMARLKMAGLNPNLVYGNGATATGGNIRSTDVAAWNPQPPQFDLGGAFGAGLGAYYDTQVKEAQVDNLKAQNTVIINEGLLKLAQALGLDQQRKMSEFDLGMKNQLKEIYAETAAQSLEKLKADTQHQLNANEIQVMMQEPNFRKAIEEILTLRANRANTEAEREAIRERINNLKYDAELKRTELELRKMNLKPGDPFWLKEMMRHLGPGINPSGKRGSGAGTTGSHIGIGIENFRRRKK